MKVRLSNLISVGFGVALAATTALAQFSNNPAANLPVGDRSGEQNQPKVRVHTDGSIYISWFDNSTGGYDVYLQRLNAAGVEQWAHNGILIADRGVSSTVDYDLRIDADGNALVAFNDDRLGSPQQITICKVSPAGTCLWGTTAANGMSGVSTVGTGTKNNPHIAVLSDGNIMLGWSESPGFQLQRLSPAGALLGAIQTISETGRTVTLCDLQPSDNASFVALWIRPFNTQFTSAKYLYTQKYDTSYATQWPVTTGAVAVVIYGPTGSPYSSQGGSVQNGYFPVCLSDGAGGAVYGWYETGGPRNCYVQHVMANGSFAFPPAASNMPALPVGTLAATQIRTSPWFDYDRTTGDIVTAWTQTDASTQSQYTMWAQKISSTGNLDWGSTGTQILATTTNQNSFVRCVAAAGGCYAMAFDARSATTGVVTSARVKSDGTLAWAGGTVLVNSNLTNKARLDVAASACGSQAILTWGDGTTGSHDILAQNINPDGTLGMRACVADIDDGSGRGVPDGGVGIEDLLYYLGQYDGGTPCADVDDGSGMGVHDGGVGIEDLLYFLFHYDAGC